MYYSHIPIVKMDYPHEPLSQRSSTELSKDALLEKDEYYTPSPRRTWRQRTPWLLLHAVLITIYTGICFAVVRNATSQMNKCKSHQIDTPARPALQDVEIRFGHNFNETEKYFGKPSSRLDRAWEDILQYQNFKFSKDDMTRYGRSHEGVQLADGSGYMGTLNMFHEMHCLKRIYMYIHKEEYYGHQNLSEFYQQQNLYHTMHCLENLRQGVQCRADPTPVTYMWGQNQKLPLANFTGLHECRNWNVFFDWAKETSFDPYVPGLVVHPIYGPAYDGNDSTDRKLGVAKDKPLVAE